MLTLSNWCISVALCIATQLVASIRQKADPAAQSLRFIEYFWKASKHKRRGGRDETKRKNCEEKSRHSTRECTKGSLGDSATAVTALVLNPTPFARQGLLRS
jgi:hypothetical protein